MPQNQPVTVGKQYQLLVSETMECCNNVPAVFDVVVPEGFDIAHVHVTFFFDHPHPTLSTITFRELTGDRFRGYGGDLPTPYRVVFNHVGGLNEVLSSVLRIPLATRGFQCRAVSGEPTDQYVQFNVLLIKSSMDQSSDAVLI